MNMVDDAPTPTGEQEAALDCTRDRAVTASAGTGKTFVLTERFIGSLRDEVSDIDTTAAITFTDMAASDMKEEVRKSVSKLASRGADPVFWDNVRDKLFSADISTIHAFCTQILRENAIEAGLEPGFTVVTGVEETALVEDALADVFGAAESDGVVRDHAATLLARFTHGQVRDMLLEMARHRAVCRSIVDSGHFVTPDVAYAHWASLVENEKRTALEALLGTANSSEALWTLAAVTHVDDCDDIARIEAAAPFINAILEGDTSSETLNGSHLLIDALFRDGLKARGTRWTSTKKLPLPNDERGPLADAIRTLQRALRRNAPRLALTLDEKDRDAASLASALVGLYGAFIDAYERLKRERCAVDYGDQLEKTRDLLADPTNGQLLESYRQRYKHILVDEFQDTDPLQWEIIELLWNEGSDERKLFIVGDPKQSIYAFRDADVTIFNSARARIEGGAGIDGDGELSTNFRSLDEIVGFVDAVFSRILQRVLNEDYEALYGKQPTTARTGEELEGTVELLLAPPPAKREDGKDDPEDKRRAPGREFSALARHVRDIVEGGQMEKTVRVKDADGNWTNRPAQFKDVAILLQARTHLDTLQNALADADVPFSVYKGTGFYQSQEVRDVASLLGVLTDRKDGAALLAVLRGPLFAVSDETLVRAALGRDYFTKALEDYASDPGAPDSLVLRMALDDLQRWRSLADRLPLHELIHRVLDESGAWAAYASLPSGPQRVANLLKLIDQVREFELVGTEGAAALVRRLDEQIRTETKVGEAPASAEEEESSDADDPGRVRIMTVHAAKGLQFPVLFVPEIHRGPPNISSQLLLDRDAGPGTKGRDGTGDMQASAARGLISARLKERSWAESKRLFYVASTRARDHLVLSTVPEKVPSSLGGHPLDRKTWLDWLFEAVEDADGAIPGEELENGNLLLGGRIKVVGAETATAPGTDPGFAVSAIKENDAVMKAPWAADVAIRPHPLPPRIERISPSRLKDFITCPSMYWAAHVLRAPRAYHRRAGDIPAMARGNVIHAALEAGLLAFDEMAARRACASEGISDPADVDKLVEESREAVEAFRASDAGKILAAGPGGEMAEQTILFPLERGPGKEPTTIECKTDLLIPIEGGRWLVVDHKTNARQDGEPDEEMRARLGKTYSLQLALYRLAAARALRKDPGQVGAAIFATALGESFPVAGGRDALRQAETKAREALDAIEAGRFDGRARDHEDQKWACERCAFRGVARCRDLRPTIGAEGEIKGFEWDDNKSHDYNDD